MENKRECSNVFVSDYISAQEVRLGGNGLTIQAVCKWISLHFFVQMACGCADRSRKHRNTLFFIRLQNARKAERQQSGAFVRLLTWTPLVRERRGEGEALCMNLARNSGSSLRSNRWRVSGTLKLASLLQSMLWLRQLLPPRGTGVSCPCRGRVTRQDRDVSHSDTVRRRTAASLVESRLLSPQHAQQ